MDFNIKDIVIEGLSYTLMGMIIVFAMLIIIMFVIKAMALFSGEEKPEEDVSVQPAVNHTPNMPVASNDAELVAVITAAIAAAMGKSASGLVIRSYKKVSDGAWNKAGRREVLENRF